MKKPTLTLYDKTPITKPSDTNRPEPTFYDKTI
jgi:hypothetical protein